MSSVRKPSALSDLLPPSEQASPPPGVAQFIRGGATPRPPDVTPSRPPASKPGNRSRGTYDLEPELILRLKMEAIRRQCSESEIVETGLRKELHDK
jgi:hypothetical protein